MDINLLQQKTGIIGNSDAINQVLEMILQVAPVNISVLVTGESGTGKEKIAKALHQASKRSNQKLITVNCGAIPEGIIESELFGHKKGAYTDARGDRKGYFETANRGTIFLDEIGETPIDTQVKLLRVIENGEFTPVGASNHMKTDVRIIAATNKDLSDLVDKNLFRKDLFYRLKTVTINLPALRDRLEDISLLVERFALEFTRSNDISYRGFMPEAIKLLKKQEWNGNIRELKNFVESILVLEKGQRISPDMVKVHLNISKSEKKNTSLPVLSYHSNETAENELILRQLFLLKQDVEFIKQLLTSQNISNLKLLPSFKNEDSQNQLSKIDNLKIDQEDDQFIKNMSIGDITMEDLEKEAIERTLKFYKNNRRATAKSLEISERTLYRKIDQYGLDRKIKIEKF